MSKAKYPVTPAVRFLRAHSVQFSEHLYSYEEKGGTAVSARELGLDEHAVIKTLVMEDDCKEPLMVLMHGDCRVSAKDLARLAGRRSITPCPVVVAEKHTGYQVGGTSPFGTRKAMQVFMEETIIELPKIYINGGKRGFLVGMEPGELLRLLKPVIVKAGIKG